MKYVKMNFLIILVASILILIPSIALISFSQTNDTLSDTLSEGQSSNQSSFSSWSRELANNQTESDAESGEDD